IFENVKGMISHNKGETIKTVLSSFNEIGYDIDFDVFNSKYYGVPQNRERIYIVGKRKDLGINESRESVKGKKKLEIGRASCREREKKAEVDEGQHRKKKK